MNVKKTIELLQVLYKGLMPIFAFIGFITTANWLYNHYVFGFHKNSEPEDILVLQNSDTVVFYRKVAPGRLHLDLVEGELTVNTDTVQYWHNLPANCEITMVDYQADGKKIGANTFLYGEKKRR